MNVRLHALAGAMIGLLLGTAAPARADSTASSETPPSQITQIQVLEPSNAKHEFYHGVLWLEHDKATSNYRWGGKHCADQGLGQSNLDLLYSAFRGKYNVSLQYSKRLFRGQLYRCITGFTIARR